MLYDKITRRHFLQGLGGFSLALPFMSSLFEDEALAQAQPPNKRFIAMWTPHGALHDNNWIDARLAPTQAYQAYTNHTIHHGPLVPLAGGGLSSVLGPSFDSMLPKINILRGLDSGMRLGHHSGGLLGNTATKTGHPLINEQRVDSDGMFPLPTIDQVMAYSPKVYTSPVQYRSLRISADGSGISYGLSNPTDLSSSVVSLPSFHNPRSIYDAIFGLVGSQSINVVDRVRDDYLTLKSNPRLGNEDRRKLDAHLTFLSELASAIPQISTCPNVGARPGTQDLSSDPGREINYALMNDLIVAALRCGVTQVVTLRANYGTIAAGGDNWHLNWAHGGDQAGLISVNKWLAEVAFLDLIKKMDQVIEANGLSILDNSVVLWFQENSAVHWNIDNRIIMAGSCGGFLRTGRHIDYTKRDDTDVLTVEGGMIEKIGFLYNRFLVTLLQAMGLSPSDYERPIDGIPNPGYGQIFQFGDQSSNHYRWRTRHDYHESDAGRVLPLIVA